MDYKTYIENILTDYTVSNEIKFAYNGTNTHVLIKNRGGGQNYLDSQILPIQLLIYTYDVEEVINTINAFAKEYSGIRFVQDLEYVRQYYETPVVISSGQNGGANNYSMISLLGTLIISSNISDIKSVKIDGVEYFTVSRKISYTTVPDTQPDDNRLGETNITNGIVQFTCSMENKNNAVCSKVRAIRMGEIVVDNSFTVELAYTDNDFVETHTMKLTSATIDSSNQTSPIISLGFTR